MDFKAGDRTFQLRAHIRGQLEAIDPQTGDNVVLDGIRTTDNLRTRACVAVALQSGNFSLASRHVASSQTTVTTTTTTTTSISREEIRISPNCHWRYLRTTAELGSWIGCLPPDSPARTSALKLAMAMVTGFGEGKAGLSDEIRELGELGYAGDPNLISPILAILKKHMGDYALDCTRAATAIFRRAAAVSSDIAYQWCQSTLTRLDGPVRSRIPDELRAHWQLINACLDCLLDNGAALDDTTFRALLTRVATLRNSYGRGKKTARKLKNLTTSEFVRDDELLYQAYYAQQALVHMGSSDKWYGWRKKARLLLSWAGATATSGAKAAATAGASAAGDTPKSLTTFASLLQKIPSKHRWLDIVRSWEALLFIHGSVGISTEAAEGFLQQLDELKEGTIPLEDEATAANTLPDDAQAGSATGKRSKSKSKSGGSSPGSSSAKTKHDAYKCLFYRAAQLLELLVTQSPLSQPALEKLSEMATSKEGNHSMAKERARRTLVKLYQMPEFETGAGSVIETIESHLKDYPPEPHSSELVLRSDLLHRMREASLFRQLSLCRVIDPLQMHPLARPSLVQTLHVVSLDRSDRPTSLTATLNRFIDRPASLFALVGDHIVLQPIIANVVSQLLDGPWGSSVATPLFLDLDRDASPGKQIDEALAPLPADAPPLVIVTNFLDPDLGNLWSGSSLATRPGAKLLLLCGRQWKRDWARYPECFATPGPGRRTLPPSGTVWALCDDAKTHLGEFYGEESKSASSDSGAADARGSASHSSEFATSLQALPAQMGDWPLFCLRLEQQEDLPFHAVQLWIQALLTGRPAAVGVVPKARAKFEEACCDIAASHYPLGKGQADKWQDDSTAEPSRLVEHRWIRSMLPVDWSSSPLRFRHQPWQDYFSGLFFIRELRRSLAGNTESLWDPKLIATHTALRRLMQRVATIRAENFESERAALQEMQSARS